MGVKPGSFVGLRRGTLADSGDRVGDCWVGRLPWAGDESEDEAGWLAGESDCCVDCCGDEEVAFGVGSAAAAVEFWVRSDISERIHSIVATKKRNMQIPIDGLRTLLAGIAAAAAISPAMAKKYVAASNASPNDADDQYWPQNVNRF
jgi:hypothetical protein